MKAKKLFPDLSFKRLWDKIKELENKVGENSDINLDELNKNLVKKIAYPNWNGTVEEIVSLVSSKSHTYTTNEDCIIYCEAHASGANGQGYDITIGNLTMRMQAPQGGIVSG